jgi:hypothetical protein
MISVRRQTLVLGLVCVLVLWIESTATAQCVMCKAVAEDSAEAGGLGEGLNRGILYLMAAPYVLLGTLGYVFFRKRRQS